MKDTINLPDGSYYTGELKNGKPEGKGVLIYTKGKTYKGNFKNGIPEGYGMLIYRNRKTYTGNLKNGKPEGKGVLIYANGKTYRGDFKNGIPEGKGIFLFPDRRSYYGDFKNGKIEGKVIEMLPDGRIFTGYFKNGIPERKETDIFPDLNNLKNIHNAECLYNDDIISDGSTQKNDQLYSDDEISEKMFDECDELNIELESYTRTDSLKKIRVNDLHDNCSKYSKLIQLRKNTSVMGKSRSSGRERKRPSHWTEGDGYLPVPKAKKRNKKLGPSI